jgi:hypothetical protein
MLGDTSISDVFFSQLAMALLLMSTFINVDNTSGPGVQRIQGLEVTWPMRVPATEFEARWAIRVQGALQREGSTENSFSRDLVVRGSYHWPHSFANAAIWFLERRVMVPVEGLLLPAGHQARKSSPGFGI